MQANGYVIILHSSAGEQYILLAPDLLVNLAASLMLLADKNFRELGALSETDLLQGKYTFGELTRLNTPEKQILLDAAILRLLGHNICFRETLGSDTLLIFPSLIKQKRPLQDDLHAMDDISYVVRGRVENLYASLVVLLGYTPSFTRINQWQNQAQYEMGTDEICGFRLIEEREGEIELVLYYGDQMPMDGRMRFQELFEEFLYQRDVKVRRYPPVVCSKGHRIERNIVIKRVREVKAFVYCDECGTKVVLPDVDKPQSVGIGASLWLKGEEAVAHLRSSYEVQLTRIKSYRRGWAAPRCYLSHLPEQALFAETLVHDLRDAGVYVIEQASHVMPNDFVVVLETAAYRQAFAQRIPALAADIPLVRERLRPSEYLISLVLDSPRGMHEFGACVPGGFYDEAHYSVSLYDLVLNLHVIPFDHVGFAPSRQILHKQWEQTQGRAVYWETVAHIDKPVETVPTPQDADITILTVLSEEYQAICSKFGSLQPGQSRSDHANLYAWRVGRVTCGENAYSVAVGMMGRAGTIQSALATMDAVKRWNPRYILFVGIAGGLKI